MFWACRVLNTKRIGTMLWTGTGIHLGNPYACRRGKERGGKERRGEERRGEEMRGEERRGEERAHE